MTASIFFFRDVSDPVTGVDFDAVKFLVPLPSDVTLITHYNEYFTSFELPAIRLVTLDDRLFSAFVPDGHSNLMGDFEVRVIPVVLEYTPEQGYTYLLQYEWTANDNSTFSWIAFNGDAPFPDVVVTYLDLPTSQVVDRAVVDFISDGSQIHGTQSADRLMTTDHAEIVYGEGGDDRIFSRGGDDALLGWDGDDWLDGGPGNDWLTGGPGIDTADYSSAAGGGLNLNLVRRVATMGGEIDRLSEIENVVGTGTNDLMIGDAADNALSGGAGDDRLDGGQGDDTLSGGLGADRLDGGDGHDVVAGDSGDDWLFGSAGDDVLHGGVGMDRLYGGDGNDRLSGGATSDRLTGGAGADTFVLLSPFHGPDQLLDFRSGEDKIEIDLAGFSLQIAGGILTSTGDPRVWFLRSDDVSDTRVWGMLAYDPVSGWLHWDSTPYSDAGDTLHIATVAGGTLTLNDLLVA